MYDLMAPAAPMAVADMGLAPGGRMRQEIYDDTQTFADWDLDHRGRCFVHLANALVWRTITGEDPPPTPATAAEYTRAGLPWFDYYGADAENESVNPKTIVELRAGLRRHEVRQGRF